MTNALEEAFLDCHADGHQWRPVGLVDPIEAEPGLRPPWNADLTRGKRWTCVSCTGERVRWYTRAGEVVNRYRMAEGYYHRRATPDDVAPTRQEWRAQLARRLFNGAAPPNGKRRRRRRAPVAA